MVAEGEGVFELGCAFREEGGDEGGGLGPHEGYGVVDEGGEEGGEEDLEDGVVAKRGGLAEGGDAHVEADEEGAVEAADDAEEGEGDELEVVPAVGVLDLVEDELAGAEGVHELEGDGGDHGGDEGLPHRLVGEVVAELLEGEEDAADGGAEGDGDAGGGGGGEDLALAGLVGGEGAEGLHEEVRAAAGDVHERALLAQPEPGGDGETQADRLDGQRPRAHELADHEAAEDGLYLGDAAVAGVGGVGRDEDAGGAGEEDLRVSMIAAQSPDRAAVLRRARYRRCTARYSPPPSSCPPAGPGSTAPTSCSYRSLSPGQLSSPARPPAADTHSPSSPRQQNRRLR